MLRNRLTSPVLQNCRSSALTVQRHFKPTGRDSYDNYGPGLWVAWAGYIYVIWQFHDLYLVRERVPRGSGPAPKITPGGNEAHDAHH